MTFEPVWISSLEHLDAFLMIYHRASFLGRAFGVYDPPADFPYLRGCFGVPCAPAVMFSSGRLQIDNHCIFFEAAVWPFPGWRFPGYQLHNLRTDWKFTVTAQDVSAVNPFESPSPVLRYFNLPFTRMQTNQGGVLADFLLCHGGLGPFMGRIRKRNAKLFAKLCEAFPAAARATSSPSESAQ